MQRSTPYTRTLNGRVSHFIKAEDIQFAGFDIDPKSVDVTDNYYINGVPLENVAQTLTNKSLVDDSTSIIDVVDNTIAIKFDAAGSAATSTTLLSSQTVDRVLTLPDADDTLVGKATTDILTNKSLVDSSTSVVDVVDNTIAIKFDAAGSTATSTTLLSSQTVDRVLTLPDADDTLVGKATTDILTNKTIDTANNTISVDADDVTFVGFDIDPDNIVTGNLDATGVIRTDDITELSVGVGVNIEDVNITDTNITLQSQSATDVSKPIDYLSNLRILGHQNPTLPADQRATRCEMYAHPASVPNSFKSCVLFMNRNIQNGNKGSDCAIQFNEFDGEFFDNDDLTNSNMTTLWYLGVDGGTGGVGTDGTSQSAFTLKSGNQVSPVVWSVDDSTLRMFIRELCVIGNLATFVDPQHTLVLEGSAQSSLQFLINGNNASATDGCVQIWDGQTLVIRNFEAAGLLLLRTQANTGLQVEVNGDTTIDQILRVNGGIISHGTTETIMRFQTDTTGSLATDGAFLKYTDTGSDFIIQNQEAGEVAILEAGGEGITVLATGDVLIDRDLQVDGCLLNIHNDVSGTSTFQMTTLNTGQTATDGFVIKYSDSPSEQLEMINHQNGNLHLENSSGLGIVIDGSSGDTTVEQDLFVNGGQVVVDDSLVPSLLLRNDVTGVNGLELSLASATGNATVGTSHGAGSLELMAGGASRWTITSAGNMHTSGAGTGGGAILHLEDDDVTNILRCTHTNSSSNADILRVQYTAISSPGTGNQFLQMRDSGGIIGSISGDGAGGVAFNVSSDQRLKTNIVDTPITATEICDGVRVRDYAFTKNMINQTGFIAQEVRDSYPAAFSAGCECIPEECECDPNDAPHSVNMMGFIPLIIKTLQEANARILVLENIISNL